jgi:hypothetical protein
MNSVHITALTLLLLLARAHSAFAGILETDEPSPTPSPSPTPAAVIQELEPSDYDSAGIGVRFDGDRVRVSGRIPKACADLLKLTDVKKSAPATSSEVQSREDLVKNSSRVGVRLRFSSPDGKYSSLSSCISSAPGERTDLESKSELSRSILTGDELALGGVLDSKNETVFLNPVAQSKSVLKLDKQFEDRDCKSCNADSRSVIRRLDELSSLDFPWVKPLMASLLESALTETHGALDGAKDLSALETSLSDLESYAALIEKLRLDPKDRERLLARVGDAYTELLAKNLELAKGFAADCAAKGKTTPTPSSCSREGKHADFIAKTFRSMARLPGVDKDKKELFLKEAAQHEKGGSKRLDFLSSLNAGNSEVRDALNRGQEDLRKLALQAQAACRFVRNPVEFQKCSEARAAYQGKLGMLQQLSQRFFQTQRAQFSGVPGAPAVIAPDSRLQVYSNFGGPSTFGTVPSVPMGQTFFDGSSVPTAPGLPPFGS